MSENIAIVSGKGGTGKSITAVNLGLAFQELGEKTIVIDGDRTSPDLALLLGLNPNQEFNLQNVLKNNENPFKAISIHDSGLMVMPCNFVAGESKIDENKFNRILKLLEGRVIVDCPPGVYEDTLSILKLVDKILIVTNPEVPAVVDSLRLLEEIDKFNKKDKVEGVILNKVEGKDYEVKEGDVESLFRLPVVSRIAREDSIKKNIPNQTSILTTDPYSEVSIEYKKLASHLSKKPYKPPKFSRFKRFLSNLKFI